LAALDPRADARAIAEASVELLRRRDRAVQRMLAEEDAVLDARLAAAGLGTDDRAVPVTTFARGRQRRDVSGPRTAVRSHRRR
jgi:hypothetical protein